MDIFASLLNRIMKGGGVVSGISLLTGMMLLISNIGGRALHFIIPGSYELFETTMTIPVAFALVYGAMHATHVTVDLIVSRFPPQLRAASAIFANLVSLAAWVLICYAAIQIACENGWEEISDILLIPYLPFRIVWIICLILFCVIHLQDIYRAVRRLKER